MEEYLPYSYDNTIEDITEKYKNNTLDPITFQDVRGILTEILELVCGKEKIWSSEAIAERRNILALTLEEKLKKNLNILLEENLHDSALTKETQDYVKKLLLNPISDFINKNMIY